jgi:hypothetical protein
MALSPVDEVAHDRIDAAGQCDERVVGRANRRSASVDEGFAARHIQQLRPSHRLVRHVSRRPSLQRGLHEWIVVAEGLARRLEPAAEHGFFEFRVKGCVRQQGGACGVAVRPGRVAHERQRMVRGGRRRQN